MIKKERLIKTFLELVQIDSPSGEEQNIVSEITKRLKTLKGSVEADSYGNVIAKFPGTGEPFMLNAHLDTVQPGRRIKPQVKGDLISSDGTTILGADPKAGVATILEVLASLKEDQKKHLPIEVVFTLGEESGLLGAINLDYKKVTAKRGITFDGEKELNNIDLSAPGYQRLDATIYGKSAHAGVEPEKGISAIKIASEIISKLKLGRIDKETTANIGIIEGGSARNAIPDTVNIKGELRSRNMKKLEKLTLKFQKVFDQVMAKYPEAKIDLTLKREFDSYLFDKNHRVIKHISKILSEINIKPNFIHSGGGTDVNIFHNHGIESVVMGTGVYEMHTTREYLVVPQMLQAAQFCEKLISL